MTAPRARFPISIALTLLGLGLPGLGHAAPVDVRVSSADPSGVRLTIDVPEIRLEPVASNPALSALSISGYGTVGRPLEPQLPERVIMVAVPPSGPIRLEATATATETRASVRLSAAPWVPRGREQDPAARQPVAPDPALVRTRPLARLAGVSWMRNQRVARVAIAPASYDLGREELTVHHRIEVAVRFATAGPAPPTTVETPDPFEGLYRETLVNYEQGRAWRRPAARAEDVLRVGPARVTQAEVVPDTSTYAGRRWVKVAIPRTGFYRVEFGQVRNSFLFAGNDSTEHDSLRLFTWPGVPVLPENSYCDSCDYREVAIQFIDFDASTPRNERFSDNRDYFYFYALGPSDWADRYDPVMPDTTFINHPYETRNYVYLTIADAARPVPGAPRRITAQSGAFSDADTLALPTPAHFRERAHFEQDVETLYFPDAAPFGADTAGNIVRFNIGWEKYFWERTTASGGAFEESFDLPGLAPSQPARFRLRVWGLTDMVAGFFDHFLGVSIPDSRRVGTLRWDGRGPATFDTTFTDLTASGNSVLLQVLPSSIPGAIDEVAIAWFDVFYRRAFEPVGNALTFESDPGGGARIYRIGPFSTSLLRVFDVTDPLAPREIQDPAIRALSASSWDLRFRADETGPRRYQVVPATGAGSGFVKPPNPDVVDAPNSSLQNLRTQPRAGGNPNAPPLSVRYLLVYHDGFRAAADTLLRWRVARLPLAGVTAPYDTFSVPISALYDQFSGGRTDPAAIRNFLRAAFFNWNVAPAFVCILGDASRDFKNLAGSTAASPLVPTFEGGYDESVQRQFATDDWILNVTDPDVVIPDFFGGRIPAADAAEALGYVRDKLLPYERSAPLGEWHDRVTLIADDNQKGNDIDELGWRHVEQTVALDREAMPSEIDRSYVYLHTYPLEAGESKPKARAAIVDQVNAGTVLFNYIGHGSPVLIADEKVFDKTDAGLLSNRTRPSIFVAASCDVGKFSNPKVESLGERLIRNLNGGAVAVLSATELAISSQNAALNKSLFERLFARDPGTGRFERSLSEALTLSKVFALENNQKYQILGDAAVQPVLPRLWVQTAVHDSGGNVVTRLPRGATLELRGQVLDRPGGTPVTLPGVARLLLEDSAPIDTLPDCTAFCKNLGTEFQRQECLRKCSYPFRAASIFRGDVSVQGGQFQTRFVVPMDAALGTRGRARGYVELGSGGPIVDGVGSDSLILDPGSIPPGDREGPRILLSFVGGATAVRPDAVLKVDLFDPSGILITGHVPQNGIIVTIDEDPATRFEITSSFRYAADSHQSGTASFRLPGLSQGPHRIRVSAADNLAVGVSAGDHRSSAVIDFEVTDQPTLKVVRALLFPNPVRSGGPGGGGQFVVDAPGDSVNVLLRIYTVAGRTIRKLEHRGGLAQVQIRWDGLDAEGAPLARGTYLFKVQVYARDERGGSTGGQRAEAEGKFVVVGR